MKLPSFLRQKRSKTSSRQRGASFSNDTPPASSTYRRNRTMTDRSTIPEVSERARIHHLRRLRRKIGFILLGVVASVIILLVCLSQFSGSVRLTAKNSSTLTTSVDTERYQKIFDEYYGKYPVERFRFITQYDRLLVYLQMEAPEVSAVRSSGVDGLGVSRYELTLRRPVASWRVEDVRYYVDAEGVTFTRNFYEEPKVAVVDNSGAKVSQGSAIASSRLLSFVGRAVALSQEKNIAITSIEIPSGSMRLLYLKGKGIPEVRMTIDRDVVGQVADMADALSYVSTNKLSLGYIDVRVLGKVFYK